MNSHTTKYTISPISSHLPWNIVLSKANILCFRASKCRKNRPLPSNNAGPSVTGHIRSIQSLHKRLVSIGFTINTITSYHSRQFLRALAPTSPPLTTQQIKANDFDLANGLTLRRFYLNDRYELTVKEGLR